MDTKTFWQIIEETRQEHEEEGREKETDQHIAALRAHLLTLSPEEVASFDDHLHQFIGDAYSKRLWRALDDHKGITSDDSFDYFRAWLVLQGEKTYHQVIRRPSSIPELFSDGEDISWPHISYAPQAELVMYIGDEVIEQQTGVHPGVERNKAFFRELGVSLEES